MYFLIEVNLFSIKNLLLTHVPDNKSLLPIVSKSLYS